MDLNRFVLCLGVAIVHLLHTHQPVEEWGQLWTGHWTPAQRLQGPLAGCALRISRQTFVNLSSRAAACVPQIWSIYHPVVAEHTQLSDASPPSSITDPPTLSPACQCTRTTPP